MEADGARIYIINEAAIPCAQERTARLIALAREYAHMQGIPLPQTLAIAKGEHGKPYFKNAPWLHFSLSHSGKYWACAFCRFEVGLDIERIAARDHAALARRFFAPAEIEFAAAGGAQAFYAVWTAKESYVKLLGTGIGGSFAHFSTVENGALCGQKLFCRFTAVPAPQNYRITLCRWADEYE